MGAKTNLILTGVAVIGITAYLATGDIVIGGAGDVAETAAVEEAEAPAFAVRVLNISAQERTAALRVRGRTEADEIVTMAAQTNGLIEEVAVKRGQSVAEGDLLCRIEVGSRAARIAQAEAALAQAEADFAANQQLNQSGFVADSRLRALRAQRDAADAALKDAMIDLDRTEIRAPFSGRVDDLPARRGQLLNVGNPCATIVATDPLIFTGQVSERSIGYIAEGQPAHLVLVTGEEREAVVSFVSETADNQTRTFRIEARVENADSAIRAGITANLAIALPAEEAHFIPGSALTLNDEGVLGVRGVNEESRVSFHPVRIIGEERDGLWVSGLPQNLKLITVGQDFVIEGQRVEPVLATAEAQRQ